MKPNEKIKEKMFQAEKLHFDVQSIIVLFRI